jgi:hypothetical protein
VIERLLLNLFLDSSENLLQPAPVLRRVEQRRLFAVPTTVPAEIEEQLPGVLP